MRPSEGEGREAFQQFPRRYAEIGGMQPIIRRAEVNGAVVYRVRVGPMGRDDAVSLCERLKASGGQCFVARN
ncbi:MAG: SPOR domain-containing protein [Pseudomonas sp.]|nr:SPOR domain-containing protein [Pseudomonas sp.]